MSSHAGSEQALGQLRQLAERYHVESSYINVRGERCDASADTLLGVLALVGAPVSRMEEVSAALREHDRQWGHQLVEPVCVAWDNERPQISMRVPARLDTATVDCELAYESGEVARWQCRIAELKSTDGRQIDGGEYRVYELPLPERLPSGYHTLTLEVDGQMHRSTILAAPYRAYDPDCDRGQSRWGVFAPLYALHSAHSWGAGDISDLARLAKWVRQQRGGVVSTLPILAALLDEPFEPSPYSPASRLFWNELYLDMEAIPELRECREAQALMSSSPFADSLSKLRAASLVDYQGVNALKRQVLSKLAGFIQTASSSRADEFRAFVAQNPALQEYACFRAVMDERHESWQRWPAPLRDGPIDAAAVDDHARQYHLYVQWLAAQQLDRLAADLKQDDMQLYLDLPLGVNRAGFDVWKYRECFAVEASGGCPPDAVYTAGQNWQFPPMHPEGIRQQGYAYVIDYLKHQMRYADILRIDHMPVFHRLYWIPPGASAAEGAYVRYHAEELYAVFSIESHRHQVQLVGEDLGTMPPEVPVSMARHHVHRMYVAQYAMNADPKAALPDVPRCSVASINTHDMPPFAAYCTGGDIVQRQSLGLLGNLDPAQEQFGRQSMVDALAAFLQERGSHLSDGNGADSDLLERLLQYLGTSQARTVLVNLEDLWLETFPQNIPGSDGVYPNWRRKFRLSLEELLQRADVPTLLQQLRRGGN